MEDRSKRSHITCQCSGRNNENRWRRDYYSTFSLAKKRKVLYGFQGNLFKVLEIKYYKAIFVFLKLFLKAKRQREKEKDSN